jgi:hypothetical protein
MFNIDTLEQRSCTQERVALWGEKIGRIKYFSVFALREETKRYSSHLNCRTGTLFLIGWVPIKLPSEINYHQHPPPNPLPQPNFLYLQSYVTSCKKSPIFLSLCASRRYVFRAANQKTDFCNGKKLGIPCYVWNYI